jgi:hypothetical protein
MWNSMLLTSAGLKLLCIVHFAISETQTAAGPRVVVCQLHFFFLQPEPPSIAAASSTFFTAISCAGYSWKSTVHEDTVVSEEVVRKLLVVKGEGNAASMGHNSSFALPVAEDGEDVSEGYLRQRLQKGPHPFLNFLEHLGALRSESVRTV